MEDVKVIAVRPGVVALTKPAGVTTEAMLAAYRVYHTFILPSKEIGNPNNFYLINISQKTASGSGHPVGAKGILMQAHNHIKWRLVSKLLKRAFL